MKLSEPSSEERQRIGILDKGLTSFDFQNHPNAWFLQNFDKLVETNIIKEFDATKLDLEKVFPYAKTQDFTMIISLCSLYLNTIPICSS